MCGSALNPHFTNKYLENDPQNMHIHQSRRRAAENRGKTGTGVKEENPN